MGSPLWEILTEEYDIVNRPINNSLYLAVRLHDFDAVREICLRSQTTLAEESEMYGNSSLHLACRQAEQEKTPKVLLTNYPDNNKSLDGVNAKNAGGFTALDIPDDKPCGLQLDKSLPQSGELKTRDLAAINRVEPPPRPSISSTIGLMCKVNSTLACHVLLVMATLLATATYLAPLSPLGGILKQGYFYRDDQNGVFHLKRSHRSVLNLFILLNSLVFFASSGMIIFLLHGFPLKPWPQISVFTLFVSYMLLIMAISPTDALPLLFIAIPFLLFAAAGRLYMAMDTGQQFKNSFHGSQAPT